MVEFKEKKIGPIVYKSFKKIYSNGYGISVVHNSLTKVMEMAVLNNYGEIIEEPRVSQELSTPISEDEIAFYIKKIKEL
jgi:hypothetical protein